MTATMYASEGGHEGCLRLFIAAGANVEQSDEVCECEWAPVCAYVCAYVCVWS